MKSDHKRTIARILNGFDLFVLILTIFLLVFVGSFTIPRIFGITPFSVRSGSMEPEIPTGSVVFVNRNDTDAEIGDIVTVGLSTGKQRGVYVTHRVHNKKEGMVQTKGDANEMPDGYLKESAIVGTVCFNVPFLGFILDKLEKNHGYLLIAIFVFFLNGISILLKACCKEPNMSALPIRNSHKATEFPQLKIVRREQK